MMVVFDFEQTLTLITSIRENLQHRGIDQQFSPESTVSQFFAHISGTDYDLEQQP